MRILLSIIIIFSGFVQVQNEDQLFWSENTKIQWCDFKGETPQGHPYDAVSSCSFSVKKEIINNKLLISKQTYFRKSTSWSKQYEQNNQLLNHEQRHFDITEIHSRLFVKEFDVEIFTSKKDIYKTFNFLIKRIDVKLSEMHKLYDFETSHSKNKVAQKKWDIKIDSLLSSLSKYKDVETIIDISYLKKD